MKDQIEDVSTFMRACGDTVEGRNVRQAARYVGMQCEELAEKLAQIVGAATPIVELLMQVGEHFKSGRIDHMVEEALQTPTRREEIFDADLDLTWVSIAAALSLGANAGAGWNQVARANLSKVDPTTGLVIRDANGKIQKPAGWTPPNHEGLVP